MSELTALRDRIVQLEKRLDRADKQPRSEYTGGVERRVIASFPPDMAGRLIYGIDGTRPLSGTGVLYYNDGTNWVSVFEQASDSITAQVAYGFPVYAFVNLPAPPTITTGIQPIAYVSNGRKSGEGPGAGTGVPAFWDTVTSQWLCFYDNSVVIA
jgi:hypothetical protein